MRHETKVLLLVSLASAVSALDLMLMFVAFPEIRETFDTVPTAQISWVLTAFTIVSASLLIAAGRLADRIGRRRIFLTGLGLFTVGSFLSAIAPTVPLLIAARVGQAVGGAMLTPSSLSLIMATHPPERRGTAIGIWAAISGSMSSVAPSVGAFIIDVASWRWAFFINVPIGVACWLIGRRILVESVDEDAAGMPDRIGIIAGMVAIASLAFAIVQTDEWGWITGRTGAAALFAVVAFAFFLWRCRVHPVPVVSLDLFALPNFRAVTLAAFAVGVTFFGGFFVFIQFLTKVWGFNALETGLRLTPLTAASVIAGYPGGWLMDRYGHSRVMAPAGLLFTAGMLVLLFGADETRNVGGVWLPAMTLIGVGVGVYFPGVNSAAAFGIPRHELGLSSGIVQTVIRLGGVTGTALAIAIVGSFAVGDQVSDFDPVFALFALTGVVLVLAALPLRTRHLKIDSTPVPSTS